MKTPATTPLLPVVFALLAGISAGVAFTADVAFSAEGDAKSGAAKDDAQPRIFEEKDGLVAVEAEHFVKQREDKVRKWHIVRDEKGPGVEPDGDPSHAKTASGGAYLEVLPDTRRTHDDKLIKGENFSNEPGKLAIVDYRVYIHTPGRYYVWVRAHSTGTEDNGIHVGLNGKWPESGQRLQWCKGKKQWWWESKQRTPKEHCGEPHKIWLDIEKPGLHTVSFSMREDGFEFDKWFMTRTREFERPTDAGPPVRVYDKK